MFRSKKGFTLIELLVVIAIIAILAAILFPVFAQAREKARQASCLSNCKQIGTALQLYIDDYDETVPPMYDSRIMKGHPDYPGYPFQEMNTTDWAVGYGDIFTWMDSIFPYVKNTSMYYCPSLKKSIVPGYACNVMLNHGIYSMNAGGTCNPYTLAGLSNVSEIVFCCDSLSLITGSRFQTALIMAPVLACGDYVGGSGYSQPARHNDSMNITYCDGHAKNCKRHQGPAVTNGGWGDGAQYWDPACYQ